MMTNRKIQNMLVELNERLQRIEKHTDNSLIPVHTWADSQQICESFKISKSILGNYRNRGMIPYSKVGGKTYYRLSDIEDLLTANLICNQQEQEEELEDIND